MNFNNSIERPSLEEVSECINAIRCLDLKTIDIDTLKDDLFLLFKGYLNRTPKLPHDQRFYRGVIWEDKPKNVKELSYPPSDKVKSYGRVNRPKRPIFYGSTSIQAIFHELNLESGDKVALSKWKSKVPLLFNNVGYTKLCFKKLRSKRLPPSWSEIKENDSDFDKVNKEIREYFSQEFTKDVKKGEEHLYKISVAIAEKHFHDKLFHGLLYPSIAMLAEADNFALKPEVVDRDLTIERVKFVEVFKETSKLEYQVINLDSADNFAEDGEIKWKGPPQKWILDKTNSTFLFKVENGKWVARDNNGNVIEPI